MFSSLMSLGPRLESATPESRIGVVVDASNGVITIKTFFYDTVLGLAWESHPGWVGAFCKKDDRQEILASIMEVKNSVLNNGIANFERRVRKFYKRFYSMTPKTGAQPEVAPYSNSGR